MCSPDCFTAGREHDVLDATYVPASYTPNTVQSAHTATTGPDTIYYEAGPESHDGSRFAKDIMDNTDLFLVFLAAFAGVISSAAAWSGWEASEVKPPEYWRVIYVVTLVLSMFVASITAFNLFLGMYN